ncbi:hypothetical protein PZ892_06590 [Sphingobacterium sp. WM]|uniref:hypothetical protein n=1 Tax=Sphingobacterium sp. WM TaxID=3031802 RepID=UPI00240DA720|nr:hypothetical protein [Sphingobacterium sp. WM]WFB64871.1 hypothetical protein PZ892_06590 [Sphingobacterium sp. WM]
MNDYKNLKAQSSTFDSLIDISKENDESLNNLSLEAKSYLLRHTWCKDILSGWLAVYWEEILGVFLFEIEPAVSGVDKYVWIVVGDIPPAYIDVESGGDPQGALESYVAIMRDWVDTVLDGESVEDCYPVEVPPTKEYAEMLQVRLDLLDNFISEELK